MSPMTQEQRKLYDENGYLVVRGFFEAAEVERWNQRFLEVVDRATEPVPEMLVMKDVMVAKGAVEAASSREAIAKIQDFHNDPVLFEGYTKHARLLDWVEEFVGGDIKSIHSMLINKPPGVDGRHPLHQDLLYFPFRPAGRIVGTWTALEACNRENGCLVVVPGSHRGELLAHESPEWEHLNFGYFGIDATEHLAERIHLEMEPGDTVFFHPILIHGSGRNRSSGFRRAISTHYASAHCEFLPGATPVGAMRPYLLVRGREQAGRI